MSLKLAFALTLVLYFTLHSLFASGKVKKRLQKHLIPYRYYRLWFNIIALLTLGPPIWIYLIADKEYFFSEGIGSMILGVVIVFSGLWLWGRSFDGYRLNEFIGTDRLGSIDVPADTLNTKGLNHWVRHPIYTISYWVLSGIFLLIPNDFILILYILAGVYMPIGIYFEEKKLLAFFGEQYRTYKKETPMLLPDVKKGLCKLNVWLKKLVRNERTTKKSG